jgi:uncharacterized protein (DUF58 family)
VGALAVVAVALPLPVFVPLVALAIVAGAVAADMWVAARRVPEWRRTQPPVLARGVPVEFEVRAALDVATARRIRQPVPPALELDPPEARGGSLHGALTGRHRGVHALGPAVVRVSGPLGLATCDHRGQSPCDVTVYPDLPRALRLADARQRLRTDTDGRSRARLGLGTELEGIRDYSPDDDIRQVNWLATARVGRPLTNVYRVDENREIVLLVDAGRLMRSPIGEGTRLDVAFDALAVLAVAADRAGDRVGALAFADDVVRVVSPRRRGAEAAVRSLFDLEPKEVESDYTRAFQAVAGRKRSLVVLFTDLVDPAAARTIVGAVPTLARRHAVLVATSEDPDLAGLVGVAPAAPVDVLRASTAVELLASRRRTFGLLRAHGCDVVEAPPERLGPDLVEAYDRLKRRARL